MGLPPALAARLAKRGIKVENRKKEDEEVFAEDKITAILDEFGKKLPKNWDKVNFIPYVHHCNISDVTCSITQIGRLEIENTCRNIPISVSSRHIFEISSGKLAIFGRIRADPLFLRPGIHNMKHGTIGII